jgi:dTDP-4-amino-4,6-dideoxygalactose transaminase
MTDPVSRRHFIGVASASGAGLNLAAGAANNTLAMLGGTPVRKEKWPSWPKFDKLEEHAWLEVLRSGKWFRGNGPQVARFEEAYAKMTGAKHCLGTANGTSALIVSLAALGVGPGDEVLVPPYTFVATVNAVLIHHALPVFVDSDLETFQMDPRKVEAHITERTRAIIPVHLGGASVDLDAILPIARKHKVPVIEDACQAHLGEWKSRKVGTFGDTGCFSFQASKNLNSGEGGAILTNSPEMVEKCYAYHNNGRGRANTGGYTFAYYLNGANLRMTEFQGTLLLAQMSRLQEQSKLRSDNGQYLSSLLKEIPGVAPARVYPGCTMNAYHLYMFRYNKDQFGGVPRATFLKALGAEGVPASGGYTPLNKEQFLKSVLNTRGFQSVFSKDRLARWERNNRCPANDQLCEEAVWLTQNMLLATRRDMDQIAEAIRKIQKNAGLLKKA